MENLWPKDIQRVRSPLTILKEQAAALGKNTANIITGEVKTIPAKSETSKGRLTHNFFLVAPALSHYRFRLFSIHHDVTLYPLLMRLDSVIEIELEKQKWLNDVVFHTVKESDDRVLFVNDEKAFIEALRVIFNSRRTRSVLSSLLSQSEGTELSDS